MKILFIDKVHSSLEENLIKHGYQCIDGTELNKNQILKIISDINGIIIRSRIKIDSFFLKKCKSLKFIGRYGSGLESIDVECAKNLNIRCINTPEGNANAFSETTNLEISFKFSANGSGLWANFPSGTQFNLI